MRTLKDQENLDRFNLLSKEELYDLYIIQNKSQIEISKIYNCSKDTIKRRIKEYNIKKKILMEMK